MSSVLDDVSTFGSKPLPSGWRVVTLEDIVADDGVFVDGDWVESKDQDPAGDVRLIQLADVGDGEYRNRSERFLTSDRASDLGCTFLEPGDLLVARMPDPLGRACIFPGDRKRAVTVVDVAVVRPRNPEIDTRWLMYFINAPRFRRVVASLQSGSTRQRISRKNLAKIVFPLPPLDWQDEAVAEIEKQFSRLDEAVANLRRVKANLKRYKSAVLKAAIEGRLVPSEAELARREGRAYESAHELLQQVLSERRQQWQGKHREHSGTTAADSESLPDGWCWCTIEQLAEVGTGATPRRSNAGYWLDGDVPWVSSAVVNEPYVDAASELVSRKALSETNLTLYPPGTLLVAMYGEGKTRGRCTELRIPATTNQAIAALQADSRVRPYLKLFLEHSYEEFRKVASGGVQPNLNLGIIRAVRVPLPPLVEQRRIVVEVDRCLSVVSDIERVVDLGKLRASRLRRAVFSIATGERS